VSGDGIVVGMPIAVPVAYGTDLALQRWSAGAQLSNELDGIRMSRQRDPEHGAHMLEQLGADERSIGCERALHLRRQHRVIFVGIRKSGFDHSETSLST
jgi:hypothetical protein